MKIIKIDERYYVRKKLKKSDFTLEKQNIYMGVM